ncbi:MAG: ATP synthase F1 subunit gamma [Bradymonadaceae bacterium]
MAKNLQDIRKRIDSVENTKQITQAMKMVAMAKLQRAEERVEAARPYANELRRVIASLAERVDQSAHPLLEQRDLRERALVIVISSDRGLCGSFNANLFREVRDFVDRVSIADENVDIATIGEKARVNYGRTEHDIVQKYTDIIGDVTYEGAREVAEDAAGSFREGRYDSVYLAYNEFISVLEYQENVERLLPLSIEELRRLVGMEEEDRPETLELAEERQVQEYRYEPDEEKLLSYALPRHLAVQVYHALLESSAAEQGARRTAMDNATENAEEKIEELTLEFNRARQAAITQEIMEIVTGAEAMEEG